MTHGTQGVLTAPFPYYGGKRWWAPTLWQRLGNPGVYVEGFAGSIACLLARPGGPGPREIVCDTDGGLCNAWRAISLGDPEEVAWWCDWPTIHQDLTARHAWLRRWVVENAARLSEDPGWFDAQAAGWWLWGISLWIGGGWCQTDQPRRPHVQASMAGRGVNAQRDRVPYVGIKNGARGTSAHTVPDKRPYVQDRPGGAGTSAQRLTSPGDQRPYGGDHGGGQGVAAQRRTRPDLIAWFAALQERLKAVVVLNRSWESAVTPTMLQQIPSAPKPTVGILMDPPYVTDDRTDTIYNTDYDGTSNEVAVAAWRWAQDNGARYRIAYCAHEGDFTLPDGWTSETRSISGIRREDRKHRREIVMFSPACQPAQQEALF